MCFPERLLAYDFDVLQCKIRCIGYQLILYMKFLRYGI